jgi:hypothetical protein
MRGRAGLFTTTAEEKRTPQEKKTMKTNANVAAGTSWFVHHDG